MDEVPDPFDSLRVEIEIVHAIITIGGDALGRLNCIHRNIFKRNVIPSSVLQLKFSQFFIGAGCGLKIIHHVKQRSDVVHLLHDFHRAVLLSLVERNSGRMGSESGKLVTEKVRLTRYGNQDWIIIRFQEWTYYRQSFEMLVLVILKKNVKQNLVILCLGLIGNLIEIFGMRLWNVSPVLTFNGLHRRESIFIRVLLQILFYLGTGRTNYVHVDTHSSGASEVQKQTRAALKAEFHP